MRGPSNSLTWRAPWCLAAIVLLCVPAAGEDWPTRLRDIRRGGITPEQLELPLGEVWTHNCGAPTPAWTESPAVDGQTQTNLKPRQNFDFCFDVAAVGDSVYFGSSRTGAVACLEAATGRRVWTFFTEAPVRCAPHVVNGRVYVGSDDGCAYCLDASDGSLVWKERVGPTDEMIWGNGRMMSLWPVRSALLVDNGEVFWAAGFFPREKIYLCKRNADDGSGGWTQEVSRPHQGYLVAASDILLAPGGKGYPIAYRRDTGATLGPVRNNARDGGCWALLTPDAQHFWSGPGETNAAYQYSMLSRGYMGSVAGGNYLIADSTFAYCNTDTQIVKIARSNRSIVWRKDCAYPYALIMAGSALFAGGDGEIAALDASTSERLWTGSVDGKAYGLAVANGRLYASTDDGSIHCFSAPIPIREMIRSFYGLVLDRRAEKGAADAWHHGYFDYAVDFGIDVRFIPREMARLFFFSEEYAARNRADAEFIADCYEVFLDRTPNQTELGNWLAGVWNRSQVVTVFSESEEFADRVEAMCPNLAGNPTRNFVTTMYIGLLDRLVDKDGLNYAAGLFDAAFAQGGVEAVRAQTKQMAREVVASPEFLGKQPTTEEYVVRFYRAFLSRFPNDSEVSDWSGEIDAGRQTTDGVIDLFAESAEFSERLRTYFGTP
ncbi:MAG TPA: PQQ-binding-like beta-propeller repeat protein [Sumerlaeia bacterium]|nr:PQQ-binding-like beta-propeller repeat protein [Sumerlaeia bacterium]